MSKFPRCAVVIVALFLCLGSGIASAHQLPHKPFSKLSVQQRIEVLKKQINHDEGVLSFFKNNPRIVASVSFVAQRQIKWHRVSLRIASRNLRKLERTIVPWYWQMLHDCEQPGSWTNGGPSSTFSGGLGIHRDIWSQLRSSWMPSWAGGAAPWIQMEVARRIMQRYGASPWSGCSPKAQAVINQEGI